MWLQDGCLDARVQRNLSTLLSLISLLHCCIRKDTFSTHFLRQISTANIFDFLSSALQTNNNNTNNKNTLFVVVTVTRHWLFSASVGLCCLSTLPYRYHFQLHYTRRWIRCSCISRNTLLLYLSQHLLLCWNAVAVFFAVCLCAPTGIGGQVLFYSDKQAERTALELQQRAFKQQRITIWKKNSKTPTSRHGQERLSR